MVNIELTSDRRGGERLRGAKLPARIFSYVERVVEPLKGKRLQASAGDEVRLGRTSVECTIKDHAKRPDIDVGTRVGLVAYNLGRAVVWRADAASDGRASAPRRGEAPISENDGAVRSPEDILELHIAVHLRGRKR